MILSWKEKKCHHISKMKMLSHERRLSRKIFPKSESNDQANTDPEDPNASRLSAERRNDREFLRMILQKSTDFL